MPQESETPKIQPGGLVTVAFLKAQLDEGNDHLGIFMPLLLDVLTRLRSQSFTTADVQEALAVTHGVAMPQHTVATLLKRATVKKYLLREAGRYQRNPLRELPASNVAGEKARIEAGQKGLGEALRSHGARRGLILESTDAALEMLFRFLEEEQVGLLLGSPAVTADGGAADLRQRGITAEFVRDSIGGDPALRGVLRGVLEGLVLYHAAFLPDLSSANRRFTHLQVVFDSVLVRQALGYEGIAARTLMRETIDLLRGCGVQCIVFDKTAHEIQRILAMYEAKLATAEGRKSLRAVPMARHFLTQLYSPSDVREMSALLEREVVAAGFSIQQVPRHVPQYTADERALAARLADPVTRDELEPRVTHDVDCVAGVLTLRRGRRSSSVDDVGAVFATSSPLVIRNTRLWWEDDEHEIGIGPMVHIRALANLAWLKKPSLCSDFKVHELVALCTAALRPRQETWQRFLRHLESLHASQRLSSDEVTAIVVSAMSDPLLWNAELEADDSSDIDAVTLDEVVDRVKASYVAEVDERVQELTDDYEGRLSELATRERAAAGRASAAAEQARRRELVIEGRAQAWARRVTRTTQWLLLVIVFAGAVALIVGHPFHSDWIGIAIGFAVVVFVVLEFVGILRHVSEWRASMEARLTSRFRDWLGGDGRAVQGPPR